MGGCGSEGCTTTAARTKGWRRTAANIDEWRRLVRDAKARKAL